MSDPTVINAYRRLWRSSSWSERPALLSADVSLNYRCLAKQVEAIAAALVAQGIEPGDVVALSMRRTGDSVVVLLAILFAGGCLCPIEPKLAADEVAARLTRVRCRFAVTDEVMAFQFEAVRAEVEVLYRTSLTASKAASTVASLTPDSPALLLFTSGSTGKPKAVLLRHRAVYNNASGVAQHTQLTERDRLLHIMPIYHTNGINNQILTPFLAGSTVAITPRFRAADMPWLMERYQPTIVSGVPTMYSRMLPYEFPDTGLENLRMIRCGSAPITPDLQRQVETKFDCPVVISYGLSEATCTSTMNPPHARCIGSVGTTLPNQIVEILDPQRDMILDRGETGEVAIRGDSLMAGYLDDQGQPDSGSLPSGWLRTGDLGKFDDNGYLFITGRLKDVIIRGGENIPPGLVEDALASHPDVTACCVVGCPDEDLGEVPIGVVIPAGDKTISTTSLIEYVETVLSRSYRPHDIVYVDHLPENSVGKIDRKAVVRIARALYLT